MRRLALFAVVLCSATLAIGCGSSSSDDTATDATGGTTTTAASKSSPGSGTVAVDLVFTGTRAVTAKGSAGTCQLGTGKDGSTSFAFQSSEDDYEGLGESISFQEVPGSDKLDVKWALKPGLAWFGTMTGSYAFSGGHHTLSIDADLPVSPGHPEHVKGIIHCP